jgi:hypothetical protein
MESLSGAATRVAMPEGRIADALSLLKDAYRIHRKLGDRHEMTIDLCRFASVLASVGRVGAATLLLSGPEAQREEIAAGERWVAEMNEETLAAIRSRLDGAAFAEAWERGRTLAADEIVQRALGELGSRSEGTGQPAS